LSDPNTFISATSCLPGSVYEPVAMEAAVQLSPADTLTRRAEEDTLFEADTLRSLAAVKIQMGEVYLPFALQHLDEAVAIYHTLEDRLGEALSLQMRSEVQLSSGQPLSITCKQDLDRALLLFTLENNLPGQAWTLKLSAEANLHFVQARSGVDKWDTRLAQTQRAAMEKAQTDVEQALDIFRRLEDSNGEAAALRVRGRVSISFNNRLAARNDLQSAHSIFAANSNHHGDADTLKLLGGVKAMLGDYEGAKADFQEGLGKYRQLGHRRGEMQCLRSLGDLFFMRYEFSEAVACLQAALQIILEAEQRTSSRAYLKDKAFVLRTLGETQVALGNLAAGLGNLEAAIPIFRQFNRGFLVRDTLLLSLRLTEANQDKALARHTRMLHGDGDEEAALQEPSSHPRSSHLHISQQQQQQQQNHDRNGLGGEPPPPDEADSNRCKFM